MGRYLLEERSHATRLCIYLPQIRCLLSVMIRINYNIVRSRGQAETFMNMLFK